MPAGRVPKIKPDAFANIGAIASAAIGYGGERLAVFDDADPPFGGRGNLVRPSLWDMRNHNRPAGAVRDLWLAPDRTVSLRPRWATEEPQH
jgi:hypothetical protein